MRMTHSIVQQTLLLVAMHPDTTVEIMDRAQVSRSTLYKWRRGDHEPNVVTVERVLNTVGCELQIVNVGKG